MKAMVRFGDGTLVGALLAVVLAMILAMVLAMAPAIGVCATDARDTSGGLAVATPRGVWVHLGEALPKEAPYVVSRAVGDGDFVPLARVTAPADVDVAAARALLYGRLLPGLPPADPAMADRIWTYVADHDDATALAELNVPAAHLIAGTAYLDTTVVDSATYRYRIEHDGAVTTTRPTDFPAAASTLAVGEVVLADAAGGQAAVTWRLPDGSEPGGLLVTRRAARKGDFTPCDVTAGFYVEADTAYATLSDPTVQPSALYEYRVTLVDRFANPGPISAPVAVTTFGEAGAPVVTGFSAEDLGDHRVRLRWTSTDRGYRAAVTLYRSDTFDGPFTRLVTLPPGTGEYVDTVPTTGENAYYRIGIEGAVETALSATVAAMSRSAAAPLPPQALHAERAGAGVRLTWEGVGPDLLGYLVERARGADEIWRQVSEQVPADTTQIAWTDTTGGLTGREAFRYRVRTVGIGGAVGDPSRVVAIVPAPEFVLPAPTGLRAVADPDGIRLFWDDLSLTEPTLAGYDVYRRTADEPRFQPIRTGGFAPRLNHWLDADAIPGVVYTYAVTMRDLEGRESPRSPQLTLTVPALTELPAPASVRIVAVEDGLTVSWGEVLDARVASYRVYRHAAEATPQAVQTVGRDVLSWTDGAARAGTTYVYSVTAVDSTGNESAPSAPTAGRR